MKKRNIIAFTIWTLLILSGMIGLYSVIGWDTRLLYLAIAMMFPAALAFLGPEIYTGGKMVVELIVGFVLSLGLVLATWWLGARLERHVEKHEKRLEERDA